MISIISPSSGFRDTGHKNNFTHLCSITGIFLSKLSKLSKQLLACWIPVSLLIHRLWKCSPKKELQIVAFIALITVSPLVQTKSNAIPFSRKNHNIWRCCYHILYSRNDSPMSSFMYMDHLHGIRTLGKSSTMLLQLSFLQSSIYSRETVSVKENMQHQLSCLLFSTINVVGLLL